MHNTKIVFSLVSLIFILAACSSSTAHSSTTVRSSSSMSVVAAAKQTLSQLTAMPKFTNPGPPIDAAKLKGDTVLVVSYDQADSALLAISQGVQQAGAALGIHVEVLNASSTTTIAEQDIAEGVSQHVNAIILDGAAANVLPVGLAAAKAAGIPVIGAVNGEPVAGVAGQGAGSDAFAEASGSYAKDGELMADTAIADSNGQPIKAVVETFDNPVATAVVNGIKHVFRGCSFCSIVNTETIEPAQWATQVTPTTANVIRSQRGINWVFPVVDSMAPFAVAGVSQAGLANTVHVVTSDGSGSGPLGLVESGKLVADPGFSTKWVGWLAMDQALRALSHMSPANPVVPIRYLDKTNLQGLDLNSQAALYGDSYITGFKKLWGIQG